MNISSIEGLQPAFDHSHYAASKAAVIMHTRAAALELGPSGIRVNCVSPGLIEAPGIEEAWPEGVARWHAAAPLQRLGDAGGRRRRGAVPRLSRRALDLGREPRRRRRRARAQHLVISGALPADERESERLAVARGEEPALAHGVGALSHEVDPRLVGLCRGEALEVEDVGPLVAAPVLVGRGCEVDRAEAVALAGREQAGQVGQLVLGGAERVELGLERRADPVALAEDEVPARAGRAR